MARATRRAKYAKMLTVIAGIVVLGSWLVENLLVGRAAALRDGIARAEAEHEASERFFSLQSDVLEVYQVAASARSYSAATRRQCRWSNADEVSALTERLERSGNLRDFAMALQIYSSAAPRQLEVLNLTPLARRELQESIGAIQDLRAAIDHRRDRYREDQVKLLGSSSINPEKVAETQVRPLRDLIESYRNDVEFVLAPRLEPAANRLFRAYDKAFEHARKELQRRESNVKWLRVLQLLLYGIGSVFAVYASWLDAQV